MINENKKQKGTEPWRGEREKKHIQDGCMFGVGIFETVLLSIISKILTNESLLFVQGHFVQSDLNDEIEREKTLI